MGSDVDSGLSDDVQKRLRKALVAVFRKAPAVLSADMPLGQIAGWDSMTAVSFSFELEGAFDVVLGETTFAADQTIRHVLSVLRERGARSV
jgi:acyl carrier protein